MSELYTEPNVVFAVSQPKPASKEWRLKLFEEVHFIPVEGSQPNWFHRKMHELFFGVKWERSYDGGRTYRSS